MLIKRDSLNQIHSFNVSIEENGFDIKVGKFPFTASGKAQSSGTSDGFVKVIFDSKFY